MQQQITQWWEAKTFGEKIVLISEHFKSTMSPQTITNDQIKHIYLMEHQEKSYTIEQAVEHLKNGGAIKIDFINDDFLTEILKLAGSDQVNKTCSRLSMYYILHDGAYWVGHPKEVANTRPTIKLSQITSDNAVNEKPTAHKLWLQAQKEGNGVERFNELLREHGLIISLKDLESSPKNWEEDYSHENGNYSNICIRCKSEFYGHKRRVVCKECVKANEPSEARIIDEDASVLSIEDSFKSMKKEVFELDCENKALSAIKKGLETSNAELVKANSELVGALEQIKQWSPIGSDFYKTADKALKSK